MLTHNDQIFRIDFVWFAVINTSVKFHLKLLSVKFLIFTSAHQHYILHGHNKVRRYKVEIIKINTNTKKKYLYWVQIGFVKSIIRIHSEWATLFICCFSYIN